MQLPAVQHNFGLMIRALFTSAEQSLRQHRWPYDTTAPVPDVRPALVLDPEARLAVVVYNDEVHTFALVTSLVRELRPLRPLSALVRENVGNLTFSTAMVSSWFRAPAPSPSVFASGPAATADRLQRGDRTGARGNDRQSGTRHGPA